MVKLTIWDGVNTLTEVTQLVGVGLVPEVLVQRMVKQLAVLKGLS